VTRQASAAASGEWRAHALLAFASGLAACALLFGIERIGCLAPLELAARDAALSARLALSQGRPDAWSPPIVIVRIGEDDIQRYGYPIADHLLATVLGRVLAGGPRAIGVDLYRDHPVGEGYEALESLTAAHPELVWVEKLADADGVGVAPPPFARRRQQVGFSDLVVDPDHRVRRALLYAWDPQHVAHLALGFRLALAYLAHEPEPIVPLPLDPSGEDPRRPLRFGRGSLARFLGEDGGYVDADDGGYQILRDFHTAAGALHSVSLGEVLEGRVDATRFRDAIVLVGTVSPSVSDRFPDAAGVEHPELATTAGVDVHALMADRLVRTALRGDPMESIPDPVVAWAGILAVAVAGGFAGIRLHSPGRLVAVLAAATAGGGLVALGASFARVWLPLPTALLAFASASTLSLADVLRRERRDRMIVDHLLTSHVSRPVRDRLWAERDLFLRDGRLRAQHATVTVLFADLVGFAAVAETMEPEALMRWLDDCLATLAAAVEEQGGIVDDYWGDGLKANFGAPVPRRTREEVEQDARQAVRCALRFDRELTALNARGGPAGAPPARMRIGIHTGPVILGSLGADQRQKLTTVGDTVNVASRLESILRDPAQEERGREVSGFLLPTPSTAAPGEPRLVRILASEETVACLGGAFRTERLGEHPVKGRSRKVVIHRVLGPVADAGSCILNDQTRGRS